MMNELLAKFREYRSQIIVFAQATAPLLVVGLAGLAYHEFVWTAVLGNVVLNAGIMVAAAAGCGVIGWRLLEAMRERIAIRRFLSEVRDGMPMKEVLEQPWLQGCIVRSYIGHVVETEGKLSSRLDQQAIEHELSSVQEEFSGRLEFPNFLVGFMVAMGLLGTFIGLLETLTGISGMLDGMAGSGESMEQEFVKLVTELRKPLAGMGIAFSASLFGLVGSLMLGLQLLSVRRFIGRVMRDARDLLSELTERVNQPIMVNAGGGAGPARAAVSEGFINDTVSELVTNINDLQELFHRSQDTSMQLNSRIDNLSRRLEQLAQSVEENVGAVKKTNDLLGFGPRMKETNESVLAELRDLNGRGADQSKTFTRLIDVLNSIDQKMGLGNDNQRVHMDALGTVSRDQLTKIEELTGLLQNINDRSQDSETRLDRKLQGVATSTTNIAAGIQQLAAKLSEIGTVGQSQLNNSSGAQQMLREAVVTVTESLADLQGQMKKVEDVQVGASRHLWEMKENFVNMNASLEALDQIKQGISQQSMLLEGNLDEMRTSQRNLARDMQREMREAMRAASAEAAARA